MKRIFSIFGVLFLMFVAACTIYVRDAYQKKLPYVQVAAVETGTFYYESEYEGKIQKLDTNRELHDFAEDYVYSVAVSVHADAAYMEIGDNAELFIGALEQERFYGRIISFAYEYSVDGKTPENTLVEVGFPNVFNTTDNGTICVKIKKETAFMDCILPQEVLFEDDTGRYIYLVKKRDGVWGAECYIERMNVKILAFTESRISIDCYQPIKYPVVVYSGEPIQSGQVVRLYP